MKKWTVIVNGRVEKRIEKLPTKEKKRILDAILALEAGPYDCGFDVKPLHGRPEWRLRVGDWRVLFLVKNERTTITAVSFSPRGGAYK